MGNDNRVVVVVVSHKTLWFSGMTGNKLRSNVAPVRISVKISITDQMASASSLIVQ
jgi:hypothetical protein